MGRANISVAITSNFNANGINAAMRKMEQLAVSAVSLHGTVGKGWVDAGAKVGTFGAQLSDLGGRIAKVGDRLTAGVTVPMAAMGGAAIATATKIDTAWYDVRKTADMTEREYERLKQSAIELSTTQPVGADTILKIESLGAQLGIQNENLQAFARTISGLEIASNLDAATAATQISQLANITQMSQDKIANFGAAIVDLGNHTATTEADMLQLALRFASAGHVAGMSEADILGIAAALSSLGMRAEAGGSSLSQVINKISLDVANNGGALQKWAQVAGMSVEDFARSWREDAAGTFQDVLKGIATSGEDMNVVLDELGVKQIRQSDAMRRLASSGDLVTETVARANRAFEENTALQTEVDKRNESLQARLDTFKNKLEAIANDVGGPLLDALLAGADALQPLLEGVADAARAFAEATPEEQRFQLSLAGIAFAAGPVLSTVGRLMGDIGKVGTVVGRVAQQHGVYREALRTTDGAMLRTLASNDSLAAKMGVSRNAMVRACGGADQFREALERASANVRRSAEETERAAVYQEGYQRAVDRGVESEERRNKAADKWVQKASNQRRIAKAGSDAVDEWTDSIDENNARQKLNIDQLEKSGRATSSATKGMMGLSAALSGVGIAIAGIAISAFVSAWVEEMERARKRAESLEGATKGLREAVSGVARAMDEETTAADGSAKSVQELTESTDRVLESQAKLAEGFRDSNADVQAQSRELDLAYQHIKDYANHSNLTAGEQMRLKEAIETVNEQCGTQYEVVDAANGKIHDQNGELQENTDQIKRNIDARKNQLRYEAQEAMLRDMYKQQAENQQNLNDLYAKATPLMRDRNEALDRYADIQARASEEQRNSGTVSQQTRDEMARQGAVVADLNGQYDELAGDIDAAETAQGELNGQIAIVEGSLGTLSGTVATTAAEFAKWAETSPRFQYFAANVKGGMDSFVDALYRAGVSTQQLDSLSEDGLRSLVENFDGSTDSVLEALRGMGDEGAAILATIAPQWAGVLDSGTMEMAQSVASARGMTLAELAGMADGFGISGQESIRAWLEGLMEGGDPAEVAAKVAADAAEAAKDEKGFADSGRANGEAHAGGVESTEPKVMASSTKVAQSGAKAAQLDEQYRRSGHGNGQAYGDGLGSKAGYASDQGAYLGRAANSGAAGQAGSFRATGGSYGSELGGGMRGMAGAVSSAATTVAGYARGPLEDLKTQGYSWGSDLAGNLAAGVRSAIDTVSSAARSVAQAVANMLKHSTPKMGPLAHDDLWGGHIIDNLVDGMGRGLPDVERMAMRVARKADITPLLPTPPSVAVPNPELYGSLLRTVPTLGATAQPTGTDGGGNTFNIYLDGQGFERRNARVRSLLDELASEVTLLAGMGA